MKELLEDGKAYTVFFERIEFLNQEMQEQLLALLQSLPTSKYMLLGSDPIELISQKKLLKSLYYFFASMSITIPRLADRKEDIIPFAEDYFSRHRERFASNVSKLTPEVPALFLQYDWPDNLKELEL